jgi:hypothetical protein
MTMTSAPQRQTGFPPTSVCWPVPPSSPIIIITGGITSRISQARKTVPLGATNFRLTDDCGNKLVSNVGQEHTFSTSKKRPAVQMTLRALHIIFLSVGACDDDTSPS